MILDRILSAKKKSLDREKEKVSLAKMVSLSKNKKRPPSFLKSISAPGEVAIIAEIKKASPTAGLLVPHYQPGKLSQIYEIAGAKAISVLTEENFFLGEFKHLAIVQKNCNLPILRKDFLFDPYQIFQSKLLGASAILLIISILSKKNYLILLDLCRALEIDALVEVHTQKELEFALEGSPDIIGINNRNLKNLKTNLETTFQLKEKIPKNITVVSESGIQSPQTIEQLKKSGISAALVGESILKSPVGSVLLREMVESGK